MATDDPLQPSDVGCEKTNLDACVPEQLEAQALLAATPVAAQEQTWVPAAVAAEETALPDLEVFAAVQPFFVYVLPGVEEPLALQFQTVAQ